MWRVTVKDETAGYPEDTQLIREYGPFTAQRDARERAAALHRHMVQANWYTLDPTDPYCIPMAHRGGNRGIWTRTIRVEGGLG